MTISQQPISNDPLVISASRRTDMPRFFLATLIEQARQRSFTWHHPYTQKPMSLALKPDRAAVLVLWSKDYGRLLKYHHAFDDWSLFFHFTINTYNQLLEPDLSPIDERLEQLKELVSLYGSKAVRWRFDPIVVWEDDGKVSDNLHGLIPISQKVARLGIRDVTVSFMDRYRKIDRRARARGDKFRFVYPTIREQIEAFRKKAEILAEMGFTIHTCCEPGLASSDLPGLRPGRCIDAPLLSEVTGLSFPSDPDRGQRKSAGCLCHKSIDIGCYTHHRCPGKCLYCYARP